MAKRVAGAFGPGFGIFLTLRVDRRPHRRILDAYKFPFKVIRGNLSEGRCGLVPETAELVVK